MKAMILAAGVGSRLDPLTRNVPKPMVPVANRPVIEHIILKLKKHGFDQIHINVHYLGDAIVSYLGDGSKWGVTLSYAREDRLWGDAGSLKLSQAFFGTDTVLVVGGDDISDTDLTALMAFHKSNDAVSTIALSKVTETSQYGIVQTDEHGQILRFQEKPSKEEAFSDTANAGIYVFESEVFDMIPDGEMFGLGKNVLPQLVADGKRVFGFLSSAYWKDVGDIAVYRQTNFDALAGKVVLDIPGSVTGENARMGTGNEIAPGVQFGTNILIGSGVTIWPGAKIGDNTIIGDGCVIEAGVTLKNTIVWAGAVVKAGTHLERCIVGCGAEVQSNVAVFDGLIVDPNKLADKKAA